MAKKRGYKPKGWALTDVVSHFARKYHFWQRGELRKGKRMISKLDRRHGKKQIEEGKSFL